MKMLFPLVLVADAALAGPPNIVYIMADDHCVQAISAYGSYRNETPQIDRLATEGMRFDNCFVTNSICAPSRAVILTGKHSHVNGVLTNVESFDGSQMTYPKLLGAAGYQTAMIGKWHLKSEPTGFDYHDVLIGQGPYYNPPMIRNGERVQREGYTTEIITDLAIDWLDQRDPDRPFLLVMQHKAPHRNWQPGPDQLTAYDDVEIPEPPTLFDDYEGRASPAAQQEMTIARHLSPFDLKLTPPRNLTEEQARAWHEAYDEKNESFEGLDGDEKVRWMYQRYVKDYLRSVDAVDVSVGALLDRLDDLGLAEDTIVVYTSDQGWYLGEHGWYDKRWMYEESFRMPLLVRWPGVIEAGSTNEDLVQNLDFAPTLLDAAGLDVPDDMQGRSFLPMLKGETPDDWRRSVYYQYFEFPAVHMVRRHRGVRTANFKLIHYYRIDEWELFDLRTDPDELRSVADDPEYAEIRKALELELEALMTQYGVTDAPDLAIDERMKK